MNFSTETMTVKPITIALISTAIVATFGLGYLVYFDQKRRTDPKLKKQLSKLHKTEERFKY